MNKLLIASHIDLLVYDPLYLNNICVPIIGCVPDFDIFSENSSAPHKFEVSDKPIDLILFSLQKFLKFSIFRAPSQIEYCVCTLK